MVMNGLILLTGIAAIAIVKIFRDMCKTSNIQNNINNINIEHDVPPKYEDIEIEIDEPPNYDYDYDYD